MVLNVFLVMLLAISYQQCIRIKAFFSVVKQFLSVKIIRNVETINLIAAIQRHIPQMIIP